MKVALVWHGDREARDAASLENSRMCDIAAALRAEGIDPVQAVYCDAFADEVRDQLMGVDGALVWVNPIEHGHDRSMLDGILREAAGAGVYVSAQPDVILKMGTKEVLVATRSMEWGSEAYLYRTLEELRSQLPTRLSAGSPRVIKQYRGNGGNGIWKVERHPSDSSLVRVRHALRGSVEQDMPFDQFLTQCEEYFERSGRIIDQPYQKRLTEGMIRCYLVGDRVAGFGRQAVNALFPAPAGASPQEAPEPGPRLYHPETAPEFQHLRQKMEGEWVSELCRTLDVPRESLPVIWDADFLFGPKSASGEDTCVLCEINVSSVYPFPDSALAALAQETHRRVSVHRR